MARSERIAFVAPRFPEGGTVGGAETLLKNLAIRAARAGRRVTFLTTCAVNHFTWDNARPEGLEAHDGMDVRFFNVDPDRDVDTFLHLQGRISAGVPLSADEEATWLQHSVNSRALAAHLSQHAGEYDRIVVGPYLFGLTHAVTLAHPDKTILVPCLHDEPFARLGCFHTMLSAVRGVAFNAEPEKELAIRLGFTFQRAWVVGMGLDPIQADPTAFPRRRRIAAPYVLFCGRREPLKGTPLLIDYMTAFRGRTGRDVKLVLTGSGAIETPPGMAPHIIDAGFVTESEKHEAMAGALAFCHPSVNESLGIVLLEAWLAGTPALVHARSAVLRDHCRRSNGGLWFLTYPEFEEQLTLLLDRPSWRQAMGQAGRAYVMSRYSWDKVDPRLWEALDA